jgi:hypothetical protein
MTALAGHRHLRRTSAAMLLACCLLLSACAGLPGLFGAADQVATLRDSSMAVETARDLIVPGRSNANEVQAALGPANVVRFDSGFEVWVYRAGSREAAGALAELVLLVDRAGVVRKARIRMPPDKPCCS